MRVGRIGVADELGLGRMREIARDVAEAQDTAHRGDVEGAVAERDPARLVEAAGHDVDLVRPIVAVAIDHRVHFALRARADEHDAAWPERHLPGVRHVGGVDSDAEARRQGDLAHLGRGGRQHVREISAVDAPDDDEGGERTQEQGRDRAGSTHRSRAPRFSDSFASRSRAARREIGERGPGYGRHGTWLRRRAPTARPAAAGSRAGRAAR